MQTTSITIWDVITAYLTGHDALLGTLAFASNRTRIAVQIVLLAGLSEEIGNSVILFANRIRPVRFVLSIVAKTLLFFTGYLGSALSLMFIARTFFAIDTEWRFFLDLVAMSYIPLLLAIFNFLPYLGYPVNLLLYGVSATYLVRILAAATSLSISGALVSTLVGFILLLLLQSTIGRPLIHLGEWLTTTAAGRRLEHDIEAALGIERADG